MYYANFLLYCLFSDEMILDFDMFSLNVQYRVFNKFEGTEIVEMQRSRIRNIYLEVAW